MGFNQAPALPYSKLGIVEDGDTASQAIEKDKYVIWKGKNYFAKTDILQGETFVVNTNLTEITEGAINGLAEAWNASLIGFPDYGNITDITSAANSSSGYTVQSNGWISAVAVQNSSSYGIKVDVHINNFTYTTVNTWNSVASTQAMLPVSKNDVVKVNYYGDAVSVVFLPCRK